MAGVAYLLRGWNDFLSAPVALATYVAALRLTGGLDDETVQLASGFLKRKLGRFARRAPAQRRD
jgi:hypothetical protein